MNTKFDLTGKVVVVTGADRGIGKGIALGFASAGCNVVVHYHTQKAQADKVVAEILQMGGQAIAVSADVSKGDEVRRMVEEILAVYSRIDTWINNAGIYPVVPLLEMSEDQWDQTIDTNLRSVFLCTKIAAEQMIAQKNGGNIINISSIEGTFPAHAHSHYNASKAGVIMFTKASCRELAPYGIRVNSVSPGLIWAPGIEENWSEGVNAWKSKVPLCRLGMPQDIANACLFLASDAAGWITGIDLIVDGGASTTPSF